MTSFIERVLMHQGCYEAAKKMKELQELLERKDALSLAIYQQGRGELIKEFEETKEKIKELRQILTGRK